MSLVLGFPRYGLRVLSKKGCHRASQSDCNFSDLATPRLDEKHALSIPHVCTTWLDMSLHEGRCIGVKLEDVPTTSPDALTPSQLAQCDHWIRSRLHPDEINYGIENRGAQLKTFLAGRLALRLALGLTNTDSPILSDSLKRPQLSEGFAGSISHKIDKKTGETFGVGLVSSTNERGVCVGVDLEETTKNQRRSIAKRILTPNELQELGSIDNISSESEMLLRFSLKEAIYKATNSFIGHFVGFQEAEVTPFSDGTANCKWFLPSNADRNVNLISARWMLVDDARFFLTWSMASSSKKK